MACLQGKAQSSAGKTSFIQTGQSEVFLAVEDAKLAGEESTFAESTEVAEVVSTNFDEGADRVDDVDDVDDVDEGGECFINAFLITFKDKGGEELSFAELTFAESTFAESTFAESTKVAEAVSTNFDEGADRVDDAGEDVESGKSGGEGLVEIVEETVEEAVVDEADTIVDEADTIVDEADTVVDGDGDGADTIVDGADAGGEIFGVFGSVTAGDLGGTITGLGGICERCQ